MQKITPCVWYDRDALEAAELYVSAFPHSRIEHITRYLKEDPSPSQLPEGTPLSIRFTLCGEEFIAMNGGPFFKPNPAISFFVDCESEARLDALWDTLSARGSILMERGAYPFSPRFGWLADKFGVSWQLSYSGRREAIVPYLMFTGQVFRKAEEAIAFYSRIFGASLTQNILRYGKDETGEESSVMTASFHLADRDFMAADNGYPHAFAFNEGISFSVACGDQGEIDRLWEALAQGGEEQQCGWLKDPYGVSWQIVPEDMEKLMCSDDPIRARRVMEALLTMKRIDLEALRNAYDGLN